MWIGRMSLLVSSREVKGGVLAGADEDVEH